MRRGVWRSRQFTCLCLGYVIGTGGFVCAGVALPYQAYALTRSSLVVGALGAVEVVPVLLVALVSGALADSVDRRRLLVAVEVALGACGVLALCNCVVWRPSVGVLFVVAAAGGACWALRSPPMEALFARSVETEQLPSAIAWRQGAATVAMVAAPAAAGVLIAAAGPSAAYELMVAAFAVSTGALVDLPRVARAADEAVEFGWDAVVEGLRYARSRPDLLGTYGIDWLAMVFGMPEALFPQLASHLGGPSALGVLYAAPAAGAFLSTLPGGRIGNMAAPGRGLVVAAGAWGVAVAALGFARSLPVAVAALVVAGALDGVSGLLRAAIWNGSIPDALRGRLASIEMVSWSTGPALGNLEGGLAAGLIGLRGAIVSGGIAAMASAAVVGLVLPALWHYRRPDAAGAATMAV